MKDNYTDDFTTIQESAGRTDRKEPVTAQKHNTMEGVGQADPLEQTNHLDVPPVVIEEQGREGDFEIIVTAIAKDVEVDSYEEGAIGGRRGIIYESNVGTYGSFKEMLDDLERKWNFPGSDYDWGAIEDGRITTNRTEDDDGMEVDTNSRLWAEFKAGERNLWLADYDVMFKFAKTYTPDEREVAKLFNIRTA
jgi:hypothetical protein